MIHHGDYIGYIHASIGSQWHAYRRRMNELDDHLGRFTQTEAVRRIVMASGRRTADEAHDDDQPDQGR